MYKKLLQELGREQWTKQGPILLEIYVLTGPKPFSYKEAELELKLNNAELGKKHLQIKDNWSRRWMMIQRLTYRIYYHLTLPTLPSHSIITKAEILEVCLQVCNTFVILYLPL